MNDEKEEVYVKPKVIYDIESLPNYFCVVFAQLNGDGIKKYEISSRRNDRDEILEMAKYSILIAHNAHGYDNLLMNYIFDNQTCTAQDINFISQTIIKAGKFENKQNRDLKNILYPYRHGRYFDSIDTMTLLASSKLRVSLKHLQVMIKWHNVLEFECNWEVDLPEDQWDECLDYCVNDVLSLKEVCLTLHKDFTLRDFVHETTGLDVHSKDPVKIAELTMCAAIAAGNEEQVGTFMYETTQQNRPTREVIIEDLLLPFIKFETEPFQKLHRTYRELVLDPVIEAKKSKKEKFKEPLLLNGVIFNFGLGGIHHSYSENPKINGSRTFKTGNGYKLVQSDVVSYYPTARIQHLKHHFDPHFLDEYKKAYAEKAEGKSTGNKMLEGYAKLKLNSVFGLYNSVYSPL